MLKNLLNNKRCIPRIFVRNKSEQTVNISELERQDTSYEVIDDELKTRENEIELKRNKSRLRTPHRNMVHDQPPYEEPTLWVHGTLRYNRSNYGRYGNKSGFNVSLCWPTKEELAEKKEYEKIAYPYTINQVVEEARQKRAQKELDIQTRQEEIVKKIQSLDQWKMDLKRKIAKKEGEALAAKEKKDRLIEEVRSHFGYSVDPRDDKFKELLEKKEKEQKKAAKQAKKKAKEEKLLATVLNKAIDNAENPKKHETKPDAT